MLPSLYCGTSGYAYRTWKPGFYPSTVSEKRFLSYYASRLNAVESNYTFRTVPSERTLQTWIDSTPPHFVFAVKAHQSTTHFRRQAPAATVPRFFAALRPLLAAGRLGPVLFQLPPNRLVELPLLEAVLAASPAEARLAFEFRHPSWFDEAVYRRLQARGAALCLAESDTLEWPPKSPGCGTAAGRSISSSSTRMSRPGRSMRKRCFAD